MIDVETSRTLYRKNYESRASVAFTGMLGAV